MKIVLTLPPIENPIKANFVDTFDNESGQYPPIGLLYIASYLLENTDHEVVVLDPQAENLTHEQTLNRIIQEKPDVLGVHVLTFHLIDCLKMIENVKNAMPHTTVVCGGPHVHIYPKETLQQKGVNFTMIGEGELSFKKLLEALENKRSYEEVDGLYYYGPDGEIAFTKINELIPELDMIPHPARHLTNINLYQSVLAKHSIATTVMTSRGCPYKCIYCDRPALGKNFRARTPENVVDELEQCVSMGIHEFNIFDDTFTVDKKRVIEICKIIIDRGLKIRWSCRSRVHLVNPKILGWMKKAGCGRISFGVESADDNVGKILQKGADTQQAREAIRMTKAAGIEVLADFIVGSPGEKEQEIEKTIKFALQEKPDYAQFSIMTPYPATQLYSMGLHSKLFPNDHWQEFAKNPDPEWETPIWGEYFSKEDLVKIVKSAYFRFYFRPGYLIKQLSGLRSFSEFRRKARAGLKVFTTRFSHALNP